MSAKMVRRILFWASIAWWALGWIGALAVQAHQLPSSDSLGVLMCWGIGAATGTVWLILWLFSLFARTWHGEKSRAASPTLR